MSIIIPTKVEKYITDAAPDEARVAVTTFPGGSKDFPCLVIVVNTPGTYGLLEMLRTAVDHAEAANKEAWKKLALSFTSAIIGELE